MRNDGTGYCGTAIFIAVSLLIFMSNETGKRIFKVLLPEAKYWTVVDVH